MGQDITEMTPSKGFVVEWISSIIGLIFTAFGKFQLKICLIFRCYNLDLFDAVFDPDPLYTQDFGFLDPEPDPQ